ncbi:MAG: fumarate hydratase, partial [Oscillospiraceae bacterium]|nr:fumarate hydratase [Oscillospiraceae bacterium]
DFEYSAMLSKRALAREIGEHSPEAFYQNIEQRALEKINATGIGAAGFGGRITALAVFAEAYPTHIAGLPVAVNICCHAHRHKKIII